MLKQASSGRCEMYQIQEMEKSLWHSTRVLSVPDCLPRLIQSKLQGLLSNSSWAVTHVRKTSGTSLALLI